MENHKPYHLPNESADGTQLLMEKLSKVAPSCFTEVRDEQTGELRRVVNFKTLRQLLGDDAVEDEKEYYEFTWPGKFDARREAAKPISKTLRPVVEDSSDWDNTENVYIEGDNLEALKLLQKSYLGKIKMIYIDPPYNTGNDFVYEDDFKDPLAKYKEITSQTTKSNPETMGRYHTNWLNMMYIQVNLNHSCLLYFLQSKV
jgi:adenine-specific DNA-methyltransferase